MKTEKRFIKTRFFPSTEEIEREEAQKSALENDGWTLVKTACGFMEYHKQS